MDELGEGSPALSALWLAKASRIRGSALAAAIPLWYLSEQLRTKQLEVPANVRDRWTSHPQRFFYGLRQLAEHGLINLDSGNGRPPIITILPLAGSTSEDDPAPPFPGEALRPFLHRRGQALHAAISLFVASNSAYGGRQFPQAGKIRTIWRRKFGLTARTLREHADEVENSALFEHCHRSTDTPSVDLESFRHMFTASRRRSGGSAKGGLRLSR